MPLTPLHLGPGIILGILTFKIFNFWAILLASIFPDIEPLILLLINPCYSCAHHGFFHSLLGAILGSLLLAAILWIFRKKFNDISLKLKINQSFSFFVLFFSSFLGWFVHIFLDNLTHFDVFLFWPLKYKIIYFGPKIYWFLSKILLILLILGTIFLYLIIKKRKKYVRH